MLLELNLANISSLHRIFGCCFIDSGSFIYYN